MRLAFPRSRQTPKIEDQLSAFAGTADLVILPELHFASNGSPPQPSDGKLTQHLRHLCAKTGLALLFGYEESCTGEVFNALQLIDGRGVAIANYRCTHPSTDRHGIGRWLTVAPIESHKLAILVGDDLFAPEIWRSLALCGVSSIVWTGRDICDARDILRTRARENGVGVVGLEASDVYAFDPTGEKLSVEVDFESLQLVLPKGSPSGPPLRRQPSLYRRLVSDASQD